MNGPMRSGGQGRRGEAPGELPDLDWRSIVPRVYHSMNARHLSILAAGVAYFAMLSIFPGLAVLVALYGLLANPATVQHQIAEIHGLIPGQAQSLISGYLESIVMTSSSKLGVSLIVSVLFGLWSARAGTVTLIQALNIAYDEEEKRGIIRFGVISLLLTGGSILFAIMALALIAAVPAALRLLPLGQPWEIIGAIAPWPVLMGLIIAALAVIYRCAPSRPQARWQWVSWGSLAATTLWIAGSATFSLYVRVFGNYNKTFGSLGAVVILLTWFYLSAYSVLLGACMNAEMERRPARGTASDAHSSMGRRGAAAGARGLDLPSA